MWEDVVRYRVYKAPTCLPLSFPATRLSLSFAVCIGFRQRNAIATFGYPFFSLGMAPVDVLRVSAAVWKWLCRCPDAVGAVEDSSSDNEFFTPPTTPERCFEDQLESNNPHSPSALVSIGQKVPRLLSPAQTARLRRRHTEVVWQLTTPPPVVRPPPSNAPLKAYQIPIKVFRPSWAP
jgi:hypothetical protein